MCLNLGWSTIFPDRLDLASPFLRIFLFFLAWGVFWLPIAIPLALFLQWRPSQVLTPTQKIAFVTSLYGLAPLLLGQIITLEDASWSAYGWQWYHHFLQTTSLGLGIGLGGLGLLWVTQLKLGWLQSTTPLSCRDRSLDQSNSPTDLNSRDLNATGLSPVGLKTVFKKIGQTIVPIAALALWIGGTEELIFRGFLIHQLQPPYSRWIAAIVTSLIFALSHLMWHPRGTLPQLPGLGLMGMVLALAYSLDHDRLSLAWGLHAGWILGMTSLETLYPLQTTGKVPVWLTGEQGHPLSGLLGLIFLALTAIGLMGLQPILVD